MASSSATAPSQDARDVPDDRIISPPGQQQPLLQATSSDHRGPGSAGTAAVGSVAVSGPPPPRTYRYETTPDGDVVYTDPSFDDVGEEQQQHHNHHQDSVSDAAKKSTSASTTTATPSSWQPTGGIRTSAAKRHNRHHSRNLSAHFFDATKLTEDDDEAQVEKATYPKAKADVNPAAPPPSSSSSGVGVGGGAPPPSSVSPSVGQKHRRMFSGDVSNPPLAHRRINSIGNAAAVDRFLQRPRSRNHHRRDDSTGLDMLTAAVGEVTNDELADAAGARTTPPTSNYWDPPATSATTAPPHPAGQPATGAPAPQRLSTALDYYDYGAPAPPPAVTSRPPGPMKPPPARSFPHPHSTPHPHAYGPPPNLASYHHTHPPPHSYYYPPPPPPHLAPPRSAYHPPPPPPPHAHPTAHPGHPPHHPVAPPPPPPPRSAYPVQYHRPPPASSLIHKSHHYSQPSPLDENAGRQPSPTTPYGDEKIESDERLFGSKGSEPAWKTTTYPPPATPPSAAAPPAPVAATEGPPGATAAREADPNDPLMTKTATASAHHRKLSSFSSIAGIMGASLFPPGGADGGEHPLKSHHRSTSSSISFLQGLDVLEGSDVMFLRNLHASTPSYSAPAAAGASGPPPLLGPSSDSAPPPPPPAAAAIAPAPAPSLAVPPAPLPVSSIVHGEPDRRVEHATTAAVGPDGTAGLKLAPGGTSKRVRRKCTVSGCPNRVVQGGLCISHGAKRKTCKHPGCTKNVKKAGLCSTHGPARKRCEAEGCGKVAVQGGRCIAHGAKKKLCSIDNCKKQAILSGMCKKHHDKFGGVDPNATPVCVVIAGNDANGQRQQAPHKKGHTRGLSIFQDLSADAVHNLLSGEDPLSL